MQDAETGAIAGVSLAARIQSAVLALAVGTYIVGLLIIGLPMREMTMRNLAASAEQEITSLKAVLAEPANARNFAAVSQVLSDQIRQRKLQSVRFTQDAIKLEKTAPATTYSYPGWFAAALAITPPELTSSIDNSHPTEGSLSVQINANTAIENLWTLAWMFTSLYALGVGLVSLMLHRMLKVNLGGLYDLQQAAQAFEKADFSIRLPLAEHAPPEIQQTKRAFNHMAYKLNQLLSSLERKQDDLHNEKERLRVTIESIGDAVVVTDAQGNIEFINPRALELSGLSMEAALGKQVSDAIPMVNEESGAAVTSPIELALRRNTVIALDSHTAIARADGSRIAIRDTAAPIRSSSGQVQGGVLVFQDETERRKLVQRLAWQAERDHLTGLYNRREMEIRMAAALYAVKEQKRPFIFCYMDLDQFKLVNDTCGHRAGDALLQRLSAILMVRVQGPHHHLARLGGDEFGMLFSDISLSDAITIVQGIRDEVVRFRFQWESQVFRLGVSFGVTQIQPSMHDIGQILSQADTACYHAKAQGGNAIQVFEHTHPALRKINDEMQWVVVITKAFEEQRFELYRQKVVSFNPAISSQHYEVLLRMRSEDGEIVAPGEFLPAAERYGLAPSFDRWVIRNILAYLDTHPVDKSCYAINLSGRSLSDPTFTEFVMETLDQHSVDPAQLCFEITETAAIDNLAECERLILSLKARGIYFALDDFGKGQSSFVYLQRLPVKYLKIDGEFVRGIDHKPENFAITKAIHTLAHELDKLTIAEQVETEAELACIKRLGVDFVQGYLLHDPEPIPIGEMHLYAVAGLVA
ncbi:MAG: EAL domain-containing protein [Thiobacillus sp.]